MFKKYNYVYEIYKEKSFTRAAQKLYISQPSLSAAVKNIEQKVGAPLFERVGSGATLTQIGAEYIKAASEIMRVENEFAQRLNDIYGMQTGTLTVGGTNYLSSYVLPQIINRFTSAYPKITVNLVEANSERLGEMVQNEQVDIVIDSFDDTMDYYEGYPLASERILLCVPADIKVNNKLKKYQISPDCVYNSDFDLSSVPPVPIDEFANENFVLLKSGNDMYNRAMSVFEKNKITPKVSFSVDQLNISYALAGSQIGICFVTDTLLKYGKFHDNVILYNINEEYGSRTLYVAYKKKKYCTKAMSEFINIAKSLIK